MSPATAMTAFLGTILQVPQRGQVARIDDALIIVDHQGMIAAVITSDDPSYEAECTRFDRLGLLNRLAAGSYLLPGFIDLHVHAPQWAQLGTALDVPLEVWLQQHTFPLEARYADLDFATRNYNQLVDTLLANGTTTATYFATIHLDASLLLARICLDRGQRALVGRVAMDDADQCPAFYRDPSPAEAVAQTRAFIQQVRAMPGNDHGRVLPVVTPRFIPSCSDELLYQLGALARELDCHVQTHCSESDWEHSFVLDRCGKSDTHALDQYGLLTRKTILAHGNFLSDNDLTHLASIGAGIAHCPLSNIYFSDAILPLAKALSLGAHVGLGTDISGGPSPSILDNARQALHGARLLESGVHADMARPQRGRPDQRISHLDAFWLATTAGGVALDLPIGLIAPGYQFDALVLDPATPDHDLFLTGDEDASALVHKIIYCATKPNIRQTWVAGRKVFDRN